MKKPNPNYSNNHQKSQDATDFLGLLQLELFTTNQVPPMPSARWQITCSSCGGKTGIEKLSDSIHHSSLRCSQCDRFVKWVSRQHSKISS